MQMYYFDSPVTVIVSCLSSSVPLLLKHCCADGEGMWTLLVLLLTEAAAEDATVEHRVTRSEAARALHLLNLTQRQLPSI